MTPKKVPETRMQVFFVRGLQLRNLTDTQFGGMLIAKYPHWASSKHFIRRVIVLSLIPSLPENTRPGNPPRLIPLVVIAFLRAALFFGEAASFADTGVSVGVALQNFFEDSVSYTTPSSRSS